MAGSTVSLKLLIDTKDNRVLFAETGKDFVDFLFNILRLPVSTVISLLTKNSMIGCLGNLYESVENLGETYMQPNQNKDYVLKPKVFANSANQSTLLLSNDDSTTPKMYRCQYSRHFTDIRGTTCPCSYQMVTDVQYVVGKVAAQGSSGSSEGGFVKGVVTYMVMDDLTVTPMSTISSMTLLNKFNVKDVGALQEKVVNLGMPEGVKILKASLQCNTVLTSVFLQNEKSEINED
ncbi:DUF674 family protein [Quillaja saponaria]|uniref:DUF674 family protein n=1 Tax=Quillaja saponaria TaxID=32244 RepID=A0AAD7VHI4_QUISA|nr:DUF674 family protein [Quillaja saponaria]